MNEDTKADWFAGFIGTVIGGIAIVCLALYVISDYEMLDREDWVCIAKYVYEDEVKCLVWGDQNARQRANGANDQRRVPRID